MLYVRVCFSCLFLVACGSVAPSRTDGAPDPMGNAGAGGRGGAASSSAGTGGTDVAGGRGGAASSSAGTGGTDVAGAGGTAACIGGGDADVIGFAYNPGCDGGSTWPTSCHANCTLNDQHYVGCANDSRVDGGVVICHASCAECP